MDEHHDQSFNPIAGLLAVAFPGAGHWFLGEKRRAAYAGAGILWLFLGGILLGGIDVIDSREDRIWFFGQACVGPLAFGADYYHQNFIKVREVGAGGKTILRTAHPTEGRDPKTGAPIPGGQPPNRKSVTKMNELGTLSATLAGMINLIIVIDAVFPTRRRAPEARVSILALRPFLDPLPLEAYWYLMIIPIALGIAVAYKAVRVWDIETFWRQALVMAAQIVTGMIALGALTFVFVQFIAPAIVPK